MGTKRINARIRSGKGSEREGTSRRKEDRRPPPPLQNIMPGNSHFEGSVGRPGSSSSASSLESGELEPYAGLPVHPVHGNGGSYAEFRLGRDPYPQLVRKLAEGPWSGGRDMANSERLATFQSMTTSVIIRFTVIFRVLKGTSSKSAPQGPQVYFPIWYLVARTCHHSSGNR